MKANRLNLCSSVRNSIHAKGYSSVAIVNAVNAALGELKATEETAKLGDGRVTKTEYKVTETTTAKYTGAKSTAPLLFDAWHSQVAKAEKIATFETIDIPGQFVRWFDRFAKSNKEAIETEAAKVMA